VELEMRERDLNEQIEDEREVTTVKLDALQAEHSRVLGEKAVEEARVVNKLLEEIERGKAREEEIMKENLTLKKKIDEAVKRMVRDEGEVIDKMCVKNIILDWYGKLGRGKEKEQKMVMEILMNMLGFSEEEREVVEEADKEKGVLGIGGGMLRSVIAPPIGGEVVREEDLEGENVREKFANFLMNETSK